MFGISPHFPQVPLSGKRLKEFQEQHAGVELYILDEFSMIGAMMLGAVDERLREIRNCPDKPYGSATVMLVGDLH